MHSERMHQVQTMIHILMMLDTSRHYTAMHWDEAIFMQHVLPVGGLHSLSCSVLLHVHA